MFRKSLKVPTPVATITVVHPSGDRNGLIESFMDGKSAFREIWKHHDAALKFPEYKVFIFFGHKFFHWINVNNKKIWIKNAEFGRNIANFNDWTNLEGEVIFSRKKGHALGIKITRII